MRRICILTALGVALLLPSVATARTGWIPPLSRTADSAARLSGQLALLARARAGVNAAEARPAVVAEARPAVAQLPRTGGAPGLIALTGLGLVLAGTGARRLRAAPL